MSNLLYRPVTASIQAPLERLWDTPLYAKALAALYGAATMIRADILLIPLVVLLIASIWDTILGRMAAELRGERIDARLARAGLLTKLTGFIYILVARLLEFWGAEHELPGLELTNGAIAAGFAVALVLMEVESIEAHRVALKARPFPMITAFIRFMRTIEGRFLVAITSPAPPPDPEVQR